MTAIPCWVLTAGAGAVVRGFRRRGIGGCPGCGACGCPGGGARTGRTDDFHPALGSAVTR